MNRSTYARWQLISLAVMIALHLTVDANAFDSFPPGSPHDEITREACTQQQLGSITTDEIITAVREADWAEMAWRPTLSPAGLLRMTGNRNYRPEHHFDRPPDNDDQMAFRRGSLFVARTVDRARHLLIVGDRDQAIQALGAALHAIQDMWSHSNLVDLGIDPSAVVNWVFEVRQNPIIDDIRFTGYDPRAALPGMPHDDTYPHDLFAKDSAAKNAEAETVLRSGRTKYAAAYEAAVESSDLLITIVRENVPQEIWKRYMAK